MSVVYITEQGSCLRKKSGKFIVLKNKEVLAELPATTIEKVVLLGNIQLSTQAISELLAQGVNIIFLTLNGKYKGILNANNPKDVLLRISQYDTTLNKQLYLEIAKLIVRRKLEGQIQTLRLWRKRGWICKYKEAAEEINSYSDMLKGKLSVQDIRGIEGSAAKIYFAMFAEVVPPPFEWNGRNRQPPKDPVNALLSLTYMLTLSEIIAQLHIHSLDICIGFLHQMEYSRPNFALDLLELCRAPYCDDFVFSLLQKEIFSVESFSFHEKQGCRLTKDTLRAYINEYHTFLNTEHNSRPPLKYYIAYTISIFRKFFSDRDIAFLATAI